VEIESDIDMPACPGKRVALSITDAPLSFNASWTVLHGSTCYVHIVDGIGNPKTVGSGVFVVAMPHNLEHGGTFTIRATHSTGMANFVVTVHRVNFTHNIVFGGLAAASAHKTADRLTLGGAAGDGMDRFAATGQVILQYPVNCRFTLCHGDLKAGWLQSVVRNHRVFRYETGSVHIRLPGQNTGSDSGDADNVDPPVRDCRAGSEFFADDRKSKTFPSRSASIEVRIADHPRSGANWIDPAFGNLQRVTLDNGFIAWLVVQHQGWARRSPMEATTFLRHVRWRVRFDVVVLDAVAQTLEGEALLAGAINHEHSVIGKGAQTPVTTGPGANERAVGVRV
jgi:hypothetical protein